METFCYLCHISVPLVCQFCGIKTGGASDMAECLKILLFGHFGLLNSRLRKMANDC